MKEWVEFEGKTVRAAVQNACKRFDLSEDRLNYEVISRGASGIFGLVGARNARIRASVPQPVETTPRELQDAEAVSDSSVTPMAVASDALAEAGRSECALTGDPAQLGRELLERIVKTLDGDASVSVVCSDGRLDYEISGEHHGVLIGKRGQTLEAIHYLVEKVVNKNSDKRLHVHVDVGGYLEKRRQELRQLAVRMAKKARKTGKAATVGQMNAHDRRIIHLELKDDPAVRTQSVGQGPIRNLIIFPRRPHAKGQDKPRRNRQPELGAE